MPTSVQERAERLRRNLAARGGSAAAELWERAWKTATSVHAGQLHEDGRPFVGHILAIAEIAALEWKLEPFTVAGALLHDALRYGNVKSPEALVALLGGPQAGSLTELVAASTRLADTLPLVHRARDNRHLQTIFEFMLEDVRAVLISIANRLSNLRHGEATGQERRRLMILNTEEVYLPLLERLGMWKVRNEMEDHCLRLRDPQRFDMVLRWRDSQLERRRAFLRRLEGELRTELEQLGIAAEIEPIYRSAGAIHRSQVMSSSGGSGDLNTLDSRSLYVLSLSVESVAQAYTALAAVHCVGAPSASDFRDYLAQPKNNGYAALHTTIIRQEMGSEPVRIVISTRRLRSLGEHGILTPEAFAHWRGVELEEAAADWAPQERAVLGRFVDSLRRAPNPGLIVVFTPAHDLIESLPVDATVLDFAYHIHTDLGRQAGRAFVNGRPVPLYERLHNGDVVRIEKDLSREWPELEWLAWVVTPKARSKLQAQLNRRPDRKGRRLIEKELKARGRRFADYESRIAALARELGGTVDELYAAVAKGDFAVHDIVDRLIFHRRQRQGLSMIVPAPEVAHRFPLWAEETLLPALCCSPAAGAPIAGRLTAAGIELHAAECPNVGDPDQRIPLVWRVEQVELVQTHVRVRAVNRVGLLHDLTAAIRSGNVDITAIRGERQAAMADFTFQLEVPGTFELSYLTNAIRSVNGVVRVEVDGQEAGEALSHLTAYLAPPQPLANPFSPGRPVSGAGLFWGRTEELEWIETRLLNSHPASSLLVRGPRRIGKTSLLKQLAERKAIKSLYRVVYVDLQAVALSPAEEIVRYLNRCLGRVLDPAGRIPRPGQREIADDPRGAFRTYLDLLTGQLQHSKKRLLVTIDEVGVLVDALQAGHLDRSFFPLLRSIMQHDDSLVFVFATSDDMVEILRTEGIAELLNVTQDVPLDHLDRESAFHLIQDPLRGQVYFDPEALNELLRVTDHHPYYLHILGAALVSHLNGERRRQVLAGDIAAIVRRQAQSNGSEFAHLWRRSDPVEQLILAALATPPLSRRAGGLSLDEIDRRLRNHGHLLDPTTLSSTLNRLYRTGTLVRVASEGVPLYRYRVALFRHWFAEHYPLARLEPADLEAKRSQSDG